MFTESIRSMNIISCEWWTYEGWYSLTSSNYSMLHRVYHETIWFSETWCSWQHIFEATIKILTLKYKTCWWHYSRQCLLVKTTTNNIYIVQLQMFSTECDYAIILFINLVSQVTGTVHYGYGSNRVVIALLSWCQ